MIKTTLVRYSNTSTLNKPSSFEPIIFKFGYGYLDKPRDFLTSRIEHSIFSPMMTPKRVSLFTDELDHYNHGAQGVMRAKFLDFVKPDLRFRGDLTYGS